jgi:hypothetical protein
MGHGLLVLAVGFPPLHVLFSRGKSSSSANKGAQRKRFGKRSVWFQKVIFFLLVLRNLESMKKSTITAAAAAATKKKTQTNLMPNTVYICQKEIKKRINICGLWKNKTPKKFRPMEPYEKSL